MNLEVQPAPLVQIATDGQGVRHAHGFATGSCLGAAMMMPVAAISPTVKLLLDITPRPCRQHPATSPPLFASATEGSERVMAGQTAAHSEPGSRALLRGSARPAMGTCRAASCSHLPPNFIRLAALHSGGGGGTAGARAGAGAPAPRTQRSSAAGSSAAYLGSSKRCRRAYSCAQPTLGTANAVRPPERRPWQRQLAA